LGLVSICATAPAVCRAELQRLGIADEFAFTLFSSEIGFRKPHPRIYDETLARARSIHADLRPGEVLFVGDTPIADIEGPRIAGMHTALVAPGAGNADVAACRPDGTLESILDLPRLLGSKIVGMGP
jgi:putative hydrolase of the HAD superfamily